MGQDGQGGIIVALERRRIVEISTVSGFQDSRHHKGIEFTGKRVPCRDKKAIPRHRREILYSPLPESGKVMV